MWSQKLGAGVDAITFAPDGRTIYTLDRGRQLIAWDVAGHTRRWSHTVHTQTLKLPQSLTALPDGDRLVGVGRASVVVWDTAAGAQLQLIPREERYTHDPVRVTSDGRVFFLDPTGRGVMGWNLTTGAEEPFPPIPGVTQGIHTFGLSPDLRWVVVDALHSKAAIAYEWVGSELRNPVTLASIWEVQFSPDGRTLALSNSAPPRVALWDVDSWQPRVKDMPCWISDDRFAFNPKFPVLVDLKRGHGCTLYSTESGQHIRSLDFALGTLTTCVAFSPDGLTCAVGGSNKQFAVFDVDL